MDSKTIESHDSLRYKLILLRTIGFFFCFGGISSTGFIGSTKNMAIIIPIVSLTVLGAILMTYAGVRLGLWYNKISKSPELMSALYNEMYRHYQFRAMALGFYLMVIGAFFLGTTTLIDMPQKTACFTILFIGVMSSGIARLIYDRR